jgi:hypothetical protein
MGRMLPLQSIVWLAAILLPLAGISERKAYHQYLQGVSIFGPLSHPYYTCGLLME